MCMHACTAVALKPAVQVMLTISIRPITHMRRRKWAGSMGVATMTNKKMLFVGLVGPAKGFEAVLWISTEWL